MSFKEVSRTIGATSLVDVLPLVVQHSSLGSAVRSLRSLLCTCQRTAQALEQECSGRFVLKASRASKLSWFGKHWRLVRSLYTYAGSHEPDWEANELEAMEKPLAAAAARCAEAGAAGAAQGRPGASQLRSIQACVLPHGALPHLTAFTTLTSLSFWSLPDSCRNEDVEQACIALAGLTSLYYLKISQKPVCLLPGTSSLTNLTSLSVGQLTADDCDKYLHYLPPQLQELTMSLCMDCYPEPGIDLSHLTGLTRLIASGAADLYRGGDSGLVVGPHHVNDAWLTQKQLSEKRAREQQDKLPPNCRHLSVKDIDSAQPLLELQQLERLEVYRYGYQHETQQVLQQLSSLSRLTDLQVNMEADCFVGVDESLVPEQDRLAADWKGLPCLRGLRLWHFHDDLEMVGASSLRSLTQLLLQRLSMHNLELEGVSWCRLADVFGGLRGLQSLWLSNCQIVGDSSTRFVDDSSTAFHFADVAGAIACLPALRDLRLACLSQWNEAASAALAAATQLTRLVFAREFGCNEFASLVGQVHKLVGLRSLWVKVESTDTFDLDAAATGLTQLSELCLTIDNHQLPGLLRLVEATGAALGRVGGFDDPFQYDPCETAKWSVGWWSPGDGDWEQWF